MLNRKSGFTLVELLAAIAIIGILAAILLPVVGKIRESGNASKCISNMKQIGAGAAMVIADNDGWLPDRLETVNASNYRRSIGNYLYPNGVPSNGGVYRCPSVNPNKKSSLGASLGPNQQPPFLLCYGRNNNLPDQKISTITQPSKRALAIESNTWNISPTLLEVQSRYAPRHRGGATAKNPLGEAGTILFIDGHVEMRVMSMNPVDLSEWEQLGSDSYLSQ
jgi:prepilin-type N-terminal cleavage/methylation domain-containing protein/prepilin-type processing-associated H-X9-DG protein